jgi:hypothetical protein
MDLNQRAAQCYGEITTPRGEGPMAADPFEDDPVSIEDASRQLRILVDRLPIALRASRKYARLDGLMARVGLFESVQLPWTHNAEDVLAALSRH